MLELGLVHVVLILSYADALRVNLHEFGQGVHQSSADAHGTAHGDILVGKLLAGDVGGRIDAGSVLAHHVGGDILELAQDIGRLARCRAIAHSDGLT